MVSLKLVSWRNAHVACMRRDAGFILSRRFNTPLQCKLYSVQSHMFALGLYCSCRTYVCVATLESMRRDAWFMASTKTVSWRNRHFAHIHCDLKWRPSRRIDPPLRRILYNVQGTTFFTLILTLIFMRLDAACSRRDAGVVSWRDNPSVVSPAERFCRYSLIWSAMFRLVEKSTFVTHISSVATLILGIWPTYAKKKNIEKIEKVFLGSEPMSFASWQYFSVSRQSGLRRSILRIFDKSVTYRTYASWRRYCVVTRQSGSRRMV
jgi:hypothetical protein